MYCTHILIARFLKIDKVSDYILIAAQSEIRLALIIKFFQVKLILIQYSLFS